MSNNPLHESLEPDFFSDVPAVLLKYQQKWVSDKTPLKVAEKSRRIGLTWAVNVPMQHLNVPVIEMQVVKMSIMLGTTRI